MYKGVHVVVAGALAAIIVAVTNSLGATAGYSGIYLGGMGGFVTGNLPIYLWGGISGIVLMFVLMPLTLEILKESGIPRYMAPGLA